MAPPVLHLIGNAIADRVHDGDSIGNGIADDGYPVPTPSDNYRSRPGK